MKQAWITLGIVAAADSPAAAFAHTDFSVGLGLGGGHSGPPPPVVYEQPAPVAYAAPGYAYGPRLAYIGGPRYSGPHYWYHHHYRPYGDRY